MGWPSVLSCSWQNTWFSPLGSVRSGKVIERLILGILLEEILIHSSLLGN